MLYLKRLEDITEADFHALVTNQVREGQHLDFKDDINITPPRSKPELLRDVSSFANAGGGDIVTGIEETAGVAMKVTGLLQRDFEDLEQQINQTCRAHLDPPVTGIRFRVVKLASGAEVFIIRIPKTWNGPHMVMMDKENRCWTRDNSGKRMMDIPDLKQALAYSEGAAERMKRFRMERVGNVIARETPIPLYSNRCIILHMFPLVSFTGNLQIDLNQNIELPPMRRGNGWSPSFTLEGKMTFTKLHSGQPYTYMLMFRNGIIEGVESAGLAPREDGEFAGKKLFFSRHHGVLIDAVDAALKAYQKLSVPTPIFGAVSFTGVKHYSMYVPPRYSGTEGIPITRDILTLPEFVVEDLNSDAKTLLKPVFDVWWQACGYHGMPNWLDKE